MSRNERDIVKLKTIEKQLRQQKDYAEMLLKTIPSAVFSVTPDNIITSWNRKAELITGYTAEEVVGKKCRVFSYEPCCKMCTLFTDSIAKPAGQVVTITTKSGEKRYISKNMDVIRNEGGEVVGGIECFDDITDRILIEDHLRESEERYAAIVNNAPEVVCIHQNGIIRFINEAGIHASGYERRELIGQSVLDFLLEPSRKTLQKAWQNPKSELTGDFEVEFITKSGQILNLIVKSSAITYEKEPATLVILIDITERKRIEDELRRKETLKSQFLANMSHEIRTPLNGILGFLELLAQSPLLPEQQELVHEAKAASELLLYLLNDILDLSKIEAGKMTMEKTLYDLRTVVEEAMALMLPKALEKKLELRLTIDPAVPGAVIGDPARLEQILNNLLSNAVKFTNQGVIGVTVNLVRQIEETAEIRFEISDTGIGIKQDDLSRLFQPFVQADASTTRKYGGTGLGLAISHQLVKMMHGKMGVESFVGKGSKFGFTVKLMLADQSPAIPVKTKDAGKPVSPFHHKELLQRVITTEPDVASQVSIPLNNQSVRETSALKPPQILLVEDNLINRKIMVKMLESRGISCDIATNGNEAIAACLENEYDVILMDCQMPEMDGYESTARIRQNEGDKRHAVIVAMTANVMEGDRDKCLNAGMDDYLGKPVDYPQLFQKIEAYCTASPIKPSGSDFSEYIETFIEDSGFDAATARELYDDFITSIPETVAEMERALRGGEFEAFRKLAHGLKGAAGSIRITPVAELMKELETASREMDQKKCTDGLEVLKGILKG